jgi:hypothetical protein
VTWAIWANAGNRGVIAEMANVLDCDLARDPTALGESRENKQRIAFSLPLAIQFQVFESDRLVRVFAVWLCRDHQK